jgi:uncharacterized protein
MAKIVLFLVVLFAALFVLRLLNPRGRINKSGEQPDKSRAGQKRLDAEPMVACAKCGALVPKSEAIVADQQSYCSDEHAQKRRARDV